MEALQDERLRLAIMHAYASKADKEVMLTHPYNGVDGKRKDYLSEYLENLNATITLLKAAEDPSVCTSEELIKIIVERPMVAAAVGEFASGRILHHHSLIDKVMSISVERIYPEIAS